MRKFFLDNVKYRREAGIATQIVLQSGNSLDEMDEKDKKTLIAALTTAIKVTIDYDVYKTLDEPTQCRLRERLAKALPTGYNKNDTAILSKIIIEVIQGLSISKELRWPSAEDKDIKTQLSDQIQKFSVAAQSKTVSGVLGITEKVSHSTLSQLIRELNQCLTAKSLFNLMSLDTHASKMSNYSEEKFYLCKIVALINDNADKMIQEDLSFFPRDRENLKKHFTSPVYRKHFSKQQTLITLFQEHYDDIQVYLVLAYPELWDLPSIRVLREVYSLQRASKWNYTLATITEDNISFHVAMLKRLCLQGKNRYPRDNHSSHYITPFYEILKKGWHKGSC